MSRACQGSQSSASVAGSFERLRCAIENKSAPEAYGLAGRGRTWGTCEEPAARQGDRAGAEDVCQVHWTLCALRIKGPCVATAVAGESRQQAAMG